MKKLITYNPTIPTNSYIHFFPYCFFLSLFMRTHTVVIMTWIKFLLLTFNSLYHLGLLPVELNFQANLNNFPLKKNQSNLNMSHPRNGHNVVHPYNGIPSQQ